MHRFPGGTESFFRKHRVPLLLLFCIFILLATLSLVSEGYYGGADNISHYLIARYAFTHPHLFFDAWGRPLFTILAAPFAQFGLHGVKIFNIFLGMLTAWFSYRIANELSIKPAFPVIVFACFTPLYFLVMPTALTEILFSFVLVLSAYLFIRSEYAWSAVAISFLPFARSEGFVLLPLFLLALLWKKQFRALPFLAAGVIFFSFAGWYFYKDLSWVFTRFPYPVSYHHPIYNKGGSLWHFLGTREQTLGLPLEILFIAGIIAMARMFFLRDTITRKRAGYLAVLLLAPFLLYVALHSVLYWKAMGGSLGLDRVLAGVMPLAALVSLQGFAALADLAGGNRYVRGIFNLLVMSAVAVVPFASNPVPFPLSPEEKTVKEAAAWLKTSPYAGRQLFYTDQNVPYYLGADPFRKNPASCVLFGDAKYLDTIPAGSVMFWDAHFGANESKIPPDSLLGNERMRLVGYFRPETPWITFGGYDYACCICLSGETGRLSDNYAIRDSIAEILDASATRDTLYSNPFENPAEAWNPSYQSGSVAHRGNFAFIMDQRTEYGPGYYAKVSGIKTNQKVAVEEESKMQQVVRALVYVNLPGPVSKANTLLVISFEDKNKPYSYTAVNLNSLKLRPGKWDRVKLTAPVPAFRSPEDLLKVYIWNPGKQLFYIDDFRVELAVTKK